MKTARFALALASCFAAGDASAEPRSAAAVPIVTNDDALRAACGGADGGLDRVARTLAERRIGGRAALDQAALTSLLRDDGAPYVWPRAWIASARDDHSGPATQRLAAALATWATTERPLGVRRCGVARGTNAAGETVIAAVAVDALADLAPLPIRSHVGSWLSIDSRVLVDASDARVLVIGADGGTRTLLSSFDRGRVVARFAPDRAGSFTVQVVADVEGGPRPVIEARVDADVAPSASAELMPGETSCEGPDADAQFVCILHAIRRSFRRSALTRDLRLDRIALAHARAMMAAKDVAHDAGDGDPRRRFEDAGLEPKIVAENVAHAEDALAAMRALYASPSHRANLVSSELGRYGLAAVTAPDGSLWVSLELADAVE